MLRWIKRLLKLKARFAARELSSEQKRDDLLTLESEAQSLRLNMEEKNRKIANLRGEIERLREGEEARITQAVRGQVEELITDAASPIVQLLTQGRLLETGKDIQVKDVLFVAQRLLRLLEDMGLEIYSGAGETLEYNPSLHEPFGGATITLGKRVVVVFPGIRYSGKVVRKAAVSELSGEAKQFFRVISL